jgi:hypothetical protein
MISSTVGSKRMRLTTSSSLFSPLFTGFIAGCSDRETAALNATMMNIPLMLTGYHPASWHQAMDVMIPKKTASASVCKLVHTLFSLVKKRVGRDMVQQAEALKEIPKEAYGSCKHH